MHGSKVHSIPLLRPPNLLTPLCALFALTAPVDAQDPAPAPVNLNTSQVRVSDRGTVELRVSNLPLSTVLQLLSVEGRRNIIASPNVKGTVTANLYDTTFEDALSAVLIPNGAGFRKVGNYIFVHTNDELAVMSAGDDSQLGTRVFTLNYIAAADAKVYVEGLVGKDGRVAMSPQAVTGLKSEATEGGGQHHAMQDFLVVTAPVAVLREVERVLHEIDVRPRQVLIEATILRAKLEDENALGIDFTVVGGVDLEKLSASSRGIQDLTLGTLPQDRFEQFNSNVTTGFTENVPDGGIHVGIIKDNVAVFLKALEEVTDTTVLANPKILALNKQKGQVIVGRRDGFMTTTVTETQAVQSVQFLETGTQLIFRPFIGDDGYVRVELHPEDSVGFVNAQGLPSEQTTEVTTNVIIRDGETILIGGLFRELTTDARSQVPGVGNIPGVGVLFRSNNDSSEREEVIILLTIHIVKDQGRYAADSLKLQEGVERMRVGVRQGLMWHGRERLAQRHYQKAVHEWECGNREKALWRLNLALHCNPRMLPAIELRERICESREWDHDASIGRDFVYRLIAREQGLPPTAFGRPEATGQQP